MLCQTLEGAILSKLFYSLVMDTRRVRAVASANKWKFGFTAGGGAYLLLIK